MKTSNIFANIPKEIEEELFENIVSKENINIKRIISYGHTSPDSGWYDQDYNEWVILLQGEAIISFNNGDEVRLKPGDYINIPSHTKHKVSWTKPNTKSVWLAIFY